MPAMTRKRSASSVNRAGADQDVVRRITRMGRADNASPELPGFHRPSCIASRIGCGPDRFKVRFELQRFANETFDGKRQFIAHFFALAVAGFDVSVRLRPDPLFWERNGVRFVEEEIVF